MFRYVRLLAEYDKANVIGTRDETEILHRHVLDSLSCLLFGPVREAARIADIGSGGGLPGVPLAISVTDAQVTLVESVAKKARFLHFVVEELGLRNVQVVNRRVEETGRQGDHRAMYDICTFRAVSKLPVLAEYGLPLLRPQGYVLAMKGLKDEEELAEGERAAGIVGGRLDHVVRVPLLPEIEQTERHIVLLKKIRTTPKKYPRQVGTAGRKPLGQN